MTGCFSTYLFHDDLVLQDLLDNAECYSFLILLKALHPSVFSQRAQMFSHMTLVVWTKAKTFVFSNASKQANMINEI